MAALAEVYLKKETLQIILNALEAKKENGFAMTISIDDDSNQYGQNVSAFASQSKEQREAKKQKFYVGNGKVFWHNEKISLGVKQESKEIPTPAQENFDTLSGELPF